MNFLNSSLKLSNKLFGAPLFFFVYGVIYGQNQRIIKNRYKCCIHNFRNDNIGHVIADIKFSPEKEHKNITHKAENKIGNNDKKYRNGKVLGKKDIMHLRLTEMGFII